MLDGGRIGRWVLAACAALAGAALYAQPAHAQG
jgi:hypothetical protein